MNLINILMTSLGLLLTACGAIPDPNVNPVDQVVALTTPTPSPTATVSPTPSPQPSASPSPIPVLTYSLSRGQYPFGQLCVYLFTWYNNQSASTIHLMAADLSYYYTLQASGAYETVGNGSPGPVGSLILTFTSQNTVTNGTCQMTIQSGQIVSLQ